MEGLREAILPTHVANLPSTRHVEGDEAHAPGHRHLRRARRSQAGEASRRRLGTRYAPGKGRRSPDR